MKRFGNKFTQFLVSLQCKWKVQLHLDFSGSDLFAVTVKYALGISYGVFYSGTEDHWLS